MVKLVKLAKGKEGSRERAPHRRGAALSFRTKLFRPSVGTGGTPEPLAALFRFHS
jgi:hypothetical protein